VTAFTPITLAGLAIASKADQSTLALSDMSAGCSSRKSSACAPAFAMSRSKFLLARHLRSLIMMLGRGPQTKIYESINFEPSNGRCGHESPESWSAWYMILPLIYVGLCLLIAWVGKRRPFGFWGYFFASIMLTPIIGCLLLAAAGRTRARREED